MCLTDKTSINRAEDTQKDLKRREKELSLKIDCEKLKLERLNKKAELDTFVHPRFIFVDFYKGKLKKKV